MINIKGKYTNCKIFNDNVDETSISQVYDFLNNETFKNTHPRFMPDIHAGAGAVIGTTFKLSDKIIPNVIGVDIGCGMSAWKIDKGLNYDFNSLDEVVRNKIPFGKNTHSDLNYTLLKSIFEKMNIEIFFEDFIEKVKEIANKTGQSEQRALLSIGSLGGGNHFLEINKGKDVNYLIIHSGSRSFGLNVANYHQKKAIENVNKFNKNDYEKKFKEIKETLKGKEIEKALKALKEEYKNSHINTGLEYIEGDDAEEYFEDMKIAQIYAQLSRRVMGSIILNVHFKVDYYEPFESVHNYIDFNDNVVRKGAISAHENELIIIPLNMMDGTLICKGKGNSNWNNSAPHGAGRLFSRSKAKENLSISEFKEKMKDVWSSCVSEKTLDESPMAYKNSDDIKRYIEPTAEIIEHIKPIYNFKA